MVAPLEALTDVSCASGGICVTNTTIFVSERYDLFINDSDPSFCLPYLDATCQLVILFLSVRFG